jgi:hypothetical protein
MPPARYVPNAKRVSGACDRLRTGRGTTMARGCDCFRPGGSLSHPVACGSQGFCWWVRAEAAARAASMASRSRRRRHIRCVRRGVAALRV